MPTALVLGVNGQDGSYLAEALLARGYGVIGVGRQDGSRYVAPSAAFRYQSLDLTVTGPLGRLLAQCQPDMVFHMAAIHGASGFQYEPVWGDMMAVNVVSLHTVLEYARINNPQMRVVYASSAKIFGAQLRGELDETVPHQASCLYSIGKIASMELIQLYRRQHKIQAGSLILFNHESPRRPASYFIPIIAGSIAAAKADPSAKVQVKTLDFQTDWSSAKELMDIAVDVAERAPDQDFVMASGATWHGRAMVEAAFARHGLDYRHHVTETLPRQDPGPAFHASIARMGQCLNRQPQQTVLDVVDWLIADQN